MLGTDRPGRASSRPTAALVGVFALKVLAYVFVIFWIRATVPRLRVDRLMDFAWKTLVPLALANIATAAVWFELAIRPERPASILGWVVTGRWRPGRSRVWRRSGDSRPGRPRPAEVAPMTSTLFLILATLGIGAALGTVLARNLVHAALYLVAFFFLVACQFVLLEAEFLAAVQVLVYIGAVAILLVFGIMLTRNVRGDETTAAPLAWSDPRRAGGGRVPGRVVVAGSTASGAERSPAVADDPVAPPVGPDPNLRATRPGAGHRRHGPDARERADGPLRRRRSRSPACS